MPVGAIYVGRPTIWGNPFAVSRSSDYHGLPGSWFVRAEDGTIHHPAEDTQTSARRKAVELYAWQILEQQGARISVEMIRGDLAGHDLVCWCPDTEPCHADFLLAIANAPTAQVGDAAAVVTAADLSHGSCVRCGGPMLRDDAVMGQADGDLSVTHTTRQAVCVACGHREVIKGAPG